MKQMQASQEELKSINEELQSTNENCNQQMKVTTSKEEMQKLK
jgi:two-component system CheB/CheR fusion protein